jgi:hypothetical protein
MKQENKPIGLVEFNPDLALVLQEELTSRLNQEIVVFNSLEEYLGQSHGLELSLLLIGGISSPTEILIPQSSDEVRVIRYDYDVPGDDDLVTWLVKAIGNL